MANPSETPASRPPTLVTFHCPFCAAKQQVDILALARTGGVACTGCNRRLSQAEVSEALARARRPPGEGPPPSRPTRIYP